MVGLRRLDELREGLLRQQNTCISVSSSTSASRSCSSTPSSANAAIKTKQMATGVGASSTTSSTSVGGSSLTFASLGGSSIASSTTRQRVKAEEPWPSPPRPRAIRVAPATEPPSGEPVGKGWHRGFYAGAHWMHSPTRKGRSLVPARCRPPAGQQPGVVGRRPPAASPLHSRVAPTAGRRSPLSPNAQRRPPLLRIRWRVDKEVGEMGGGE